MNIVSQKILAGFLNRHEVLAQAQNLAVVTTPEEKTKFWDDYRIAQETRAQLPNTPIPTATVSPLPTEAATHIAKVEVADFFQREFGGESYSFQFVNLEALQPNQIFLNSTKVYQTPQPGDLHGVLNYCLPADATLDGEISLTQTGFRFSTTRYGMGLPHLVKEIRDGKIVITPTHPNLLQVAHFTGPSGLGPQSNRLIVLNGNHRASELLKAGHAYAPALVLTYTNANDLYARIPQQPSFWNLGLQIHQPRPPLISDFLTPLAIECRVPLPISVVDIIIKLPG